MKLKKWIRRISFGIIIIGSSFLIHDAQALPAESIESDHGTCCPDPGPTCVIGTFVRPDSYYSDGEC